MPSPARRFVVLLPLLMSGCVLYIPPAPPPPAPQNFRLRFVDARDGAPLAGVRVEAYQHGSRNRVVHPDNGALVEALSGDDGVATLGLRVRGHEYRYMTCITLAGYEFVSGYIVPEGGETILSYSPVDSRVAPPPSEARTGADVRFRLTPDAEPTTIEMRPLQTTRP